MLKENVDSVCFSLSSVGVISDWNHGKDFIKAKWGLEMVDVFCLIRSDEGHLYAPMDSDTTESLKRYGVTVTFPRLTEMQLCRY